MKKVMLTLAAWSLLSISCEKREAIQPVNDFSEIISNFNSMYRTGIKFQASHLREFTSLKDGKIVVDYEGLNKRTIEELNGQFFGGSFNSIDVWSNSVKPKSKSLRYDDGLYTDAQQAVVDDYVGQMYNVADSYSANYLVQDFQNTIIYSGQFTYDEQVELIAVVQAGDVLSDYVFSGMAGRDVGIIFAEYTGQEYGTMGCSVTWRNVWLASSVGFFTGAVSGAYVGATGGTVVLPLVGTVTGGVAGAVFGGAGGFIGGVGTGIAAELLGSCFR